MADEQRVDRARLDKSIDFYAQAIAVDPDSAEAHAGVGEAYRRAIGLSPNDADALSYFASWSWMQGAADDAVIYYRRALQVDPLSLQRAPSKRSRAWASCSGSAVTKN